MVFGYNDEQKEQKQEQFKVLQTILQKQYKKPKVLGSDDLNDLLKYNLLGNSVDKDS